MKKLKNKIKKWFKKPSNRTKLKSLLFYMVVWMVSMYAIENLVETKRYAMMLFGGIMYIYGTHIESAFDRIIKELKDNGH